MTSLEILLILRGKGYSFGIGTWKWCVATGRYTSAAGNTSVIQWVGPFKFSVRNLTPSNLTEVL